MSAENRLLTVLEKIVKLQKSLHQIALKKTDILKADDIEALGQLMKDELKHIKAIEMVNGEREQIQRQLANELLLPPTNITISQLLKSSMLKDKESLRKLQVKLVKQTQSLKEINEFNQQLLQQSLNFVNLNLDLVLGQQESGNYTDNSSNEEEESTSRSLFDSKA
ncbi:flagellar protein FlgN [Bacillus seohaeanensis]|uniref:Flagellar protein FlgN n=1 Tax=Bacillus seohaeanensis TaxID=284580 RepID=A0ABW5RLB5_9BACI